MHRIIQDPAARDMGFKPAEIHSNTVNSGPDGSCDCVLNLHKCIH